MTQRRPILWAHLLLLGIVLVWGATFTVIKDALRDASPLVFNLLRMTVASAALLAINWRWLRPLPPRALFSGATAGLFLAAGYQFQTAGLARTTPANSAFLTGLFVVFVPVFNLIPAIRPANAHAPRLAAFTGTLLAFAGLLLLTTPPGTQAAALLRSIGPGDWLSLVCAVGFAAHLLTLAHASPVIPIRQLATLQIVFCTLFMLLTLPLEPVHHLTGTPRLAGALLLTGLVGTALAFTVQSWAQQFLRPTHTALLITLEPVFAYLTAMAVHQQTLERRSFAGSALILAGMLVAELLPGDASGSVRTPGDIS
ncbi:MAG: DMT family transporter [Acidobacteriota bacterium]|nr:DMT family transporter [Acidobacteriota bacterium]